VITVSCPKCNKVYSFDESRIPPDLEVLQCKMCETYFFLAPDDENSIVEDSLFLVPREEEIEAKEEYTTSPLDFCSDRFALEHEEDDQIVELTEQVQIQEENTLPQSALTNETLSFESIEYNSDFEAEAAGEMQVEEGSKYSQAAFAAERFRYLNAKRRDSRRKILLYCSIALLSLFLACYVFFM